MNEIWRVTTEPVTEPVVLEEAKTHLRVEHDDDDSYISDLCRIARQWVEMYQRRALITQTITLYLADWPSMIYLPRPRLQSVTSIYYTDTGGTNTLLSSSYYTVDTIHEPGRIYEAWSYSWPSARPIDKAITIVYVAGYGDAAANVPDVTKHAIKLLIGHWYENRQTHLDFVLHEIPLGIRALLDAERVNIFPEIAFA